MKDRCKQAASGMWYARATWTDPLTGERRFKHVTERTQAKCGAALVQVIADGRAGRIDRADTMTVAALLDTWLSAKRGRVRPSSYTYYESCVRTRIIPRLGKVRLHKLTPAVIQRVYREMDEDGMSASAITSTHRVLHNALAFAERQGYVARNPVSLAEPPQYRAPEAAVWTAEHAAAFLSWCDREPMYGPLMALALYTGLRQGELLAIRWSDVDLAAAVLRVRASSYRGTVGEPKTQSSRRSVVLSPACVEMLRRHHAEREAVGRARPADLAFSRPDGRLLSFVTLRKRFIRGCEQAGVPVIRFHGLRHTHATLLLQAGVHPKVVQERLGHSSIAMTLDRYSHHITGLQAPAAAALDQTIRAVSVQNAPERAEESA